MKAAEDRLRSDVAEALDQAVERCIPVHRSVSPRSIIVGSICA
jgi:hypothetical protein